MAAKPPRRTPQRILEAARALYNRFGEPNISTTRIAAELGISLRSLYRDIATLQAQGADIEGAAGLGFVLRPGFLLPPLMFTEDEIAALVLGSNWVARRGDAPLARAAGNALAKIGAVLPPDSQCAGAARIAACAISSRERRCAPGGTSALKNAGLIR